MQLYFIRHGQSENNALFTQTGDSKGRSHDPELTPIGHQQAKRVAEYLRQPELFQPSYLYKRFGQVGSASESLNHDRLTHVYCSLMVRAVATAAYICDSLGVTQSAFVDLHEAGGIYLDQPVPDPDAPDGVRYTPVGLPGQGRSYFEKNYPGLVLPPNLNEHGWWDRPYETMAERPLRAQRVIETLLACHGPLNSDGTEDRVALVSHGGFYNHFLRALIGLPPRSPDQELANVWFEFNNTAITRIDYLDGHFTVVYMNDTHFLPPHIIT